MSPRLSLVAAAFACLALLPWPVVAQDTPLTRLEPIRYETGFLRDAVRKLWRISDPAPHHTSGVKVSCPNGSAGSGAIVRTVDDKAFVVVTNHHVIEGCEGGTVNILGMRNSKTNAKVVWWDAKADVAVLINTTRGVANGLPVLNEQVPDGSEIEVLAFGGPGRMVPEEDIRPFLGKVIRTSYPARIVCDAYTVSGDSGAGFIYQGALCGINWGHYETPSTTVEGWHAGKPCASNVDGPWLARTLTRVCQPYNCRPVIRGPQTVILEPPANQPVPAQNCQCDEQSIVDSIVSQYGDQLRGQDGRDGLDAQVTPEQLGAIAAAITEQLKNDPSLVGPQGNPGPPGMDGQPPTQTEIQAAVAAYFADHPQTISLALIDEDGREIDRDTTEIGGVLRLQFYEAK